MSHNPVNKLIRIAAVSALLATAVQAQFPSYRLVEIPEIGTIPISSRASGINESGQVVGHSNGQFFMWSQGTGTVDLQFGFQSAPGVETGRPLDAQITDGGVVYASVEGQAQRTSLYSITGSSFSQLPMLPTANRVGLTDVNNLGVAVGYAVPFSGGPVGVAWIPNRPTPRTAAGIEAVFGVTDGLVFTGELDSGSAFIADRRQIIPLNTPAGWTNSVGIHTTDRGRVVGMIQRPSGGSNPVTRSRPYLWDLASKLETELPLPANTFIGHTLGVQAANHAGLAVGFARANSFTGDPFGLIWNVQSMEAEVIDDLVTNLQNRAVRSANDINESGWIAVTVERTDGEVVPGVLIPQ